MQIYSEPRPHYRKPEQSEDSKLTMVESLLGHSNSPQSALNARRAVSPPIGDLSEAHLREIKMADTNVVSSNAVFNVLEEWNEQLSHTKIDLNEPQP